MRLIPVTLPPGRLRLATRPRSTGSSVNSETIGIVAVAALAAIAEGSPPTETSALTGRRTSSAASTGSRSYSPNAERYSTATFRPSMAPVSANPRRIYKRGALIWRPRAQKANCRQCLWLSVRYARPCRDAADKHDELASLHCRSRRGCARPSVGNFRRRSKRPISALGRCCRKSLFRVEYENFKDR